MRGTAHGIAHGRVFQIFLIITILVSSVALTLEDVNLINRPTLLSALRIMDIIILVIFALEMLIKCLGLGLRKYSTDPWCWIEITVLAALVISASAAVPVLRSVRILRLWSILNLSSRMKEFKAIIVASFRSMNTVMSVTPVCFLFWLVFSIMGVQMFAGRFEHCVDENADRVNTSFVNYREECFKYNLTWTKQTINFDNTLNAFLALFQVATFKGWIDIMHFSVDSTQIYWQPEEENNMSIFSYYVLFITFVVFFILNIYIGAIIYSYIQQKKQAEECTSSFTSSSPQQRKYLNCIARMIDFKPVKAPPKPESKIQAAVFNLVTSIRFDMGIMAVIVAHLVAMAYDHYDLDDKKNASAVSALRTFNIICICIYTLEAVLKIFALRCQYFKDKWHLFDFVVTLLMIIAMAIRRLLEGYYVPPIILRVIEVIRLLPHIRGSRGICSLIRTFCLSLRPLLRLSVIFLILMVIFAVFGMFLFKFVKHSYAVDELINFETFGQSMLVLFQISTGAGWDGVLMGLMSEDDCYPQEPEESYLGGNCGNRPIAIFFLVLYVGNTYFVLFNMILAVVLEGYKMAVGEEQSLTQTDMKLFYIVWQRFDPVASGFVPQDKLADLLDALPPPMRVPKAIYGTRTRAMDIKICEGQLVHCSDILAAIAKRRLQGKGGRQVGDSDEVLEALTRSRGGLEPVGSTYGARPSEQE